MREVDNEENLEKILRISQRVFALFYASWCPFCRSFLPVFENFAHQNNEDDVFLRVKIDDENNPLWEKYAVEVVPTVVLFKRKKLSRRLNGVLGLGLSEKQLGVFLESS